MTITPLHAGNPGPITGSGNWTYLFPGDSPLLIDAGVGHPAHVDAVQAAAAGRPLRVVVTHAHSDHAAGAPALRQRLADARFLKAPWAEPDALVDVPWEALADLDRLDTDEGPLQVIHTPGHAPDHVALWHAASRSIFTADLLVAGSSVVIPASRGGVLADYLRSLARVAALEPLRAYPAHGPFIEDPAALIAQYVAHREGRERQVLEALAAAPATIPVLVARIYERLDPALVPMAHESVLAHLMKLETEARVVARDGRWRLRI